mgnify:CR=1 FL=1
MGDNYEKTYESYDHYEDSGSWGSELGISQFYNALDIQLEAFSLVAQLAAFPLYSIGLTVWSQDISSTTS